MSIDLRRPLMTPSDVAARLAVSERTVLRMVDAGTLEGLRLGPDVLRFRPEDVEATGERRRRRLGPRRRIRCVVA